MLPRTGWESSGRRFSCFLSHYKKEAGSDARYLHDILTTVLGHEVFLDSNNLSDLRHLFHNGVHISDCVVLLATKDVLTRPWCLLEMHQAVSHGIPIIILPVAQKDFDWEDARHLIENLEAQLPARNPGALDELVRVLGSDDLTQLKANLRHALRRQSIEVILRAESRQELALAAQGWQRRRRSALAAGVSHVLMLARPSYRATSWRRSSMPGGSVIPPQPDNAPPQPETAPPQPDVAAAQSDVELASSRRKGGGASGSNPSQVQEELASAESTSQTRVLRRLLWRPNGTNNQVLADVTDLCERMAFVTGRTLTWHEHPHRQSGSEGRLQQREPGVGGACGQLAASAQPATRLPG